MRIFKKEISGDALLALISDSIKKININTDIFKITKIIEELYIDALSADWCTIWFYDSDMGTLHSDTVLDGKRTTIDTKEGIIGKCYQDKEPIVVSILDRDKLYDKSVDNINQLDFKGTIYYPILSENRKIKYIIQISNSLKAFHQLCKEDLEKLDLINSKITPVVRKLLEDNAKTSNHVSKDNNIQSSSDFLAEVAHEIRTPMNAIMGFLELLQLDETNEEKKQYIDTALKSGTMMVALINDLLDFSKIEKGKMELESIEYNPIEEFSAIGPLFASRMKKSGIKFHTFIDPKMPAKIKGDPYRIKQVLTNFIGNAIKFTPKNGRVELDIIYNKKTNSLDFSVEDTGVGISKERQNDIFLPYQQEKRSTTREFGGTGLGLSICVRLVEMLNAEIGLESEVGKGSKFSFSVPLEGNIIKTAINYDKKFQEKLKIGLIFKDSCSLTFKMINRYLSSFGISDDRIIPLANWKESKKLDITHIFCGKETLDKDAMQPLLDEGRQIIIMKDDMFVNYKKGLSGSVSELPCSFDPIILSKAIFGISLSKKMDSLDEISGKILIVDDNPINVQFLNAVLTRMGLETKTADSGKSAIEVYHTEAKNGKPFDIIFMDERMPHMSGIETIKEILQIEKQEGYKHCKLVGLTGDSTAKYIMKAKEAGVDKTITKPIEVKEVASIVKEYLLDL